MSEPEVRYVEKVVTVTAYATAPAARAGSSSIVATLQFIAFAVFVLIVVALCGLVAFAFYKVATRLNTRVQDKLAHQDRFTFSDKGIGIKVKNQTEEDKNIAAQRLANKIWQKMPSARKGFTAGDDE